MQHKSVSCGDTECRQKPGEAKTNWILIDYDSMINFCQGKASTVAEWCGSVSMDFHSRSPFFPLGASERINAHRTGKAERETNTDER